MVWGKKEIMKYATTNKDSFALKTFKELDKMIESEHFKGQMRDVIKTINIQGFFEMNQDVYDLEYYCDKKEELSKKHWFSFVDYLKEKITLYELHSDKEWVKSQMVKKLSILNRSEKINTFFRYDMANTFISFDVKTKSLMFTQKTKYNNVKCQLKNNTRQVNINSLVLFDFSFLNKRFTELFNYLDDDLVMLFFKNICGLLSNDDFADILIIYVKNNLKKIIEEWTLNNKGDDLKLDSFPIDFHAPEFLSQIRSKKKYSDFFKKIEKKQKSSNFNFYKIKEYYKNFLFQVINDRVDLKTYPYNCEHNKKDLSFNDEQITELKSELIPLLEKIEEQGKIFFKIYGNFGYFRGDSGSKNFINQCCRDEGIISQLIELLDWYPKKFNFYRLIFTNRNFNKEIDEYSHIKYASKVEGFDYNIYIELCKYDDKEKWPEKRFDQLQNISNKVLGNATIGITERGFDREMPESLKSADRYNFYNNSIHSKYFIEK